MTKNNDINAPLPIVETKGGTNITTYTTGDLLYASGANTLAKLPISTTVGAVLTSDGSLPTWQGTNQNLIYAGDFITSSGSMSAPPLGWESLVSGSGANVEINSANTQQSAAHPGVAGLTTGTTSAGAIFYGTVDRNASVNSNTFVFSGGSYSARFLIKLGNLSDGSDTYTLRIGFGSTQTGDQLNGCYFEYTHSVNSGNYTIKTAKANVRTTANTANPASTNWDELRIDVNAAGTSVGYFVNGVQCTGSPIATNIPTAAIGLMMQMTKTLGANPRLCNIDLFQLYYNLTSVR